MEKVNKITNLSNFQCGVLKKVEQKLNLIKKVRILFINKN